MSKKKKRDRDGKAPEQLQDRPSSGGEDIAAIVAQLASMKDNAQSSIDVDDPEDIWRKDVAACEAATDILTALQDEGIQDPEQVRDLVHDYQALAEQYRTLHQHYIEPAKPERLGTLPFTVICPKCHRQVKPVNSSYCSNCGKRLGWGR